MDDLKDKLIQAYNDGSFFEFIHKIYYQDKKEEKILPNLIAGLHNSGEFDIIELFNSLKNTPEKHDFFTTRHVFEDVLPDLNAPVAEVANCVKHLTLEAGQDMAAYMLLPPFREFCQKDRARTKALFDFALTNFDEEFDHLSTAIEAGANIDETEYVNQSLELLNNENETIKQRVIFALGRINYKNKSLLEPVLDSIQKSSALSSSDVILATAMRALFSITSQSENLETFFIDFLATHSERLDDHYIHTASEILFYDGKKVSSNVEPRLLDICCHTKPENKRTIDNIDYALERLLNRNDFVGCIEFLERFFELSEYKLSVIAFDSFVRELRNHRETHLSSLLTRWLLSKKIKLGKCCYDLLRDIDKGISIGFDKSCFPDNSKSVYLFLARKACGWFFNQPKTAISLIESIIPDAPEDDLDDIQLLIFNPLCISYPGSIRLRMEKLQKSSQKRLKDIASNILSDLEKYQGAVKAALEVNELKPSEQNRHTYLKHHNKLMNESMKQARSESLFTSLFSESILLYGNKSIHYIHHGEQKTRQEVPLQEISHSIELASMFNLDPHGLENMIWQFKAEGCRS
ncbi:hypothetical protein [Desulfobacter curvatus]|uniref:hypothetical protein n=1 Tax=Desulfobacter curvatus TaxID=2290 RepID=UPI00037E7B01|nr:hypothetical protein [Desulfobacter curvatus]